ncbi:MAG: TRAP transporter small permease subunit [Acidimicrobiales bacterium]
MNDGPVDASGGDDHTLHVHAEPAPDEITEEFEHPRATELAAEAARTYDPPRGVMLAAHRFRCGIERVSGFGGGISRFLVWVVFLIGMFNVITRYLSRWLEEDLIVAEMFEGQSMVFAFIALSGFAYGMREGVNPRVDFWWAEFTNRRKARIDLTFHLLLFIPFCWLAVRVLWTPTLRSFGQNQDGSWDTWRFWQIWEQSPDASGLPRAPIRGAILLAFTMMLLQTVAEIIKMSFVMLGRDDLAGVHERNTPLRIE